MYLKSIEIQGFKSFANKIVFEFHNGITGIVGPNGSGKSNVADAVRWVLGEQSAKQLRGANMQDIIFAGTESRRPQGFAYVSITLDNSDHQLAVDYDTVTVSRRVYRSGESEYMLNGTACRLKDINELFYDTGIGKEGYSIIGQGQIDKILSGKPEERRELFDEAAGIVKFKRRKSVALKKLENEKQNLVRVNDILAELEKQVGPLKRQSETAREYLRLREELKIFDVNHFLSETAGIKTQKLTVEENIRIVSADLEQNTAKAESLKAEYDRLDAEIGGINSRLDADKQTLTAANVEIGGMEGQINVLHEQINTEKMNREHIKSRLSAIDAELENRETSRAGYQKDREECHSQMEKLTRDREENRRLLEASEARVEQLETEIEGRKSGVISALNEKAAVTARQQRYETMLEQVNVRRSEVCQRLLKSKSDESVQEEYLKGQEAILADLDSQIAQALEGQKRLEAGLFEQNQEYRRLTKNLNDKQQEYHTGNTRLESLRNLAERYEGYGSSIRRVMEVRDRVRGIHGVVADLISTKKQYETAIETALGGSIQNIVTDSEETAKQLIQYLKKNKYGRATFLPLTSIGSRGGFQQDAVLKEPGVLGLASELVEVAKEYEGLARYLLGRIVVVDGIDNAIALARKYHYSLRIVTLEGELFNSGGSMTGGAFKNSSNLLGRRREIEELEALCEKAVAQVEALQYQLNDLEQRIEKDKGLLETQKASIQEMYLKQNTIHMNISQANEKRQEIVEGYQDLVRENRQLEEQIVQIGASLAALDQEITQLEEKDLRFQSEAENLTASLEEERHRRQSYSDQEAKYNLEYANISQRDAFLSENSSRILSEVRKLKEEAQGLNQGIEDSARAEEEKQAEIADIRLRVEEKAAQIEELTARIDDLTGNREKTLTTQKEFFKTREELNQSVSKLDKDLFRLQNQLEKLEERMEGLAGYMWSEYELTYSSAEELYREDLGNPSDLKKKIESLKAAIRELGNVNVNAIEDYKEISERYEFMKSQHDDLVRSEETLYGIIEELDTGMRRQFEEKFQEIRAEFDRVFKELFGGGRGTLELVEGEDILEAGIQIISQPPGKKLQNMMQLSGGEKALTAIALLFAIQNLKPSPFCLLDEIEAALDDSNVDRFARYLHKLTKNTQFIVITHRRGTMTASDRLYGITMQEKGVSTLVSVNLIEEDLPS